MPYTKQCSHEFYCLTNNINMQKETSYNNNRREGYLIYDLAKSAVLLVLSLAHNFSFAYPNPRSTGRNSCPPFASLLLGLPLSLPLLLVWFSILFLLLLLFLLWPTTKLYKRCRLELNAFGYLREV